MYIDAGCTESFQFAGAFPLFLELGARAVCSLENMTSLDAVSSLPFFCLFVKNAGLGRWDQRLVLVIEDLDRQWEDCYPCCIFSDCYQLSIGRLNSISF